MPEVQGPDPALVESQSLAPTPDEAIELAEAQDLLDSDPLDLALAGVAEEVPPPAKSYAFDWATRRFVRSGASVLAVHGDDTFNSRVIKILNTPRGGAPIHEFYGVAELEREIGAPTRDVDAADLEARITDALLDDPLVVGVEEFEVEIFPDAPYGTVSFVVLRDRGDDEPDEIPVTTTVPVS